MYQWRPNSQQRSEAGSSCASSAPCFWIERTYDGTSYERNCEPQGEAAPRKFPVETSDQFGDAEVALGVYPRKHSGS